MSSPDLTSHNDTPPQDISLQALDSCVNTSLENNDSEHEKFKNSWLMRLFESTFFDMSIALGYLFNSKNQHVQSYLCSRLYNFPAKQVDFYLPQLINLYLQVDELSDPLEAFFLHSCGKSIIFSLKLAWLLNAFTRKSWVPTKLEARGTRLMFLILSEQTHARNGVTTNDAHQVRHTLPYYFNVLRHHSPSCHSL